jgi:hypothetical protein
MNSQSSRVWIAQGRGPGQLLLDHPCDRGHALGAASLKKGGFERAVAAQAFTRAVDPDLERAPCWGEPAAQTLGDVFDEMTVFDVGHAQDLSPRRPEPRELVVAKGVLSRVRQDRQHHGGLRPLVPVPDLMPRLQLVNGGAEQGRQPGFE